jgi:hypothetical protein
MLVGLTKTTRIWGATIAALLYAVCVLAPTIAFALGDQAHAVHCLIEDHGASTAIQMPQHSHAGTHADGMTHEHSGAPHEHSKAPDHKGKAANVACCGLAFTSALPAVLIEVPVLAAPRACEVPEHQPGVASLAPDRLYKPPIVLLSL